MRSSVFLSALLTLASTAQPILAQACGTVGPDFGVGDITSVINSAGDGTIDSFMPGITVCNFGSSTVPCQASTPTHPVEAVALYRFTIVDGASRMEQVGQSWVFHEFFMLEGSACCACTTVGGGNLGPGCSSTTSASSMSNVPALGPRTQVNPASGAFPYPFTAPPATGTAPRRCQVPVAELAPTSATRRYYAEVHAVTAAEAALPLNRANNATYRELAVSGSASAWNFALSGLSQRGQEALRAWAVNDPSVTIITLAAPSGGSIVVGQSVTPLGDGRWRYEYAVLNRDAPASVRSISVPIPLGLAVTNLGFHDVAYHSGDGVGGVNVDGTDWPAALSGGRMTWSTPNFATNPNGNALRWRTTYNFRFDAYAPPVAGNVDFEEFEPTGSPTFSATLLVPASVGGGGVFCSGDGSGTVCPCFNISPFGAGEGCLNSLGVGGRLARSGNASIGSDSVALRGSGMPNASVLYFQGSTQQSGGAGAAFGDGLRCASGSVIRLGTQTNAAGASAYPAAGDPSVSVRGSVSSGQTFHYQAWYRNAAPFCTASTFNLTNGVTIAWFP